MKASIDQLVDKLERQVKRYREMRAASSRAGTPTTTATSRSRPDVGALPAARSRSTRSSPSAAELRGSAPTPGRRARRWRPSRRAGTARQRGRAAGSTACRGPRRWDTVVDRRGARPRRATASSSSRSPTATLVVEDEPTTARRPRDAVERPSRRRIAPRRSGGRGAGRSRRAAIAGRRSRRTSTATRPSSSRPDAVDADRRRRDDLGRAGVRAVASGSAPEHVVAAPSGSTATSGRSRRCLSRRPRPAEFRHFATARLSSLRSSSVAALGALGTLSAMSRRSDSLEKALRFGEGRRMKRLRSRPPTSPRSSPTSRSSPTPSCAPRRSSSGSGSRTARSSRISSSRRSPPCARRGSASPTSASSTSR